MSNPILSRYILAAAALVVSGGCAGGDSLQELTPEPPSQVRQVEPDRLTSLKQEISSVGYSTYLGFANNEQFNEIAVDGAGNAYVAGTTLSFGNPNIFVAKLSPSGSLLYFIYYPGYMSTGIAVDGSGSAYVVTSGSSISGSTLTKIDPTGTTIVYSATLSWNYILGVRVDSSGNAYVAGSVSNGSNGYDVAVGKVNSAGNSFVYAMSFGGAGKEVAEDLAIDPSGNVYVTGYTESANFPLANASQTTLRGYMDGFVAKLNATGNSLLYSTYLGGAGADGASAIAVDSSGNAYVTGTTQPVNGVQNFPVSPGSVQTAPPGGADAFAVKFGPSGRLLYSTYIGGSVNDSGMGIAVGSTGAVYVVGVTNSANFPTTFSAFQRSPQGEPYGFDIFVTQLSPTFNSYAYSTYLGGNSTDAGASVAVDPSNNVYVAGETYSTNFPTNVYAPGGMYDAFVTKFNGP